MANSYLDEGIVLHRRPYKEVDRIVALLTKEHGKQAVIARGVRKPQARNAAGLDLLAHSSLELMPGRALTVLIRAQLIGSSWPANDLLRTACASVLCEALGAVAQEGLADPALFDLALLSRDRLADHANDPHLELMTSLLYLCRQAGYLPDLHNCCVCSEPVSISPQWFIPSQGGVAHQACLTSDLHAMRCGSGAIALLKEVLGEKVNEKIPPTNLSSAIRLLTSHLAYQVDHRFRSTALLNEIDNLQIPEFDLSS